jgi:hypothetical protein
VRGSAPLVAIHQPNFFPWLGYFDKLARADVFVLLDDAQFPKKGGTWINRVRMLVNGSATWVTVPVDRSYHGVRAIREMRIEESVPWRQKMLKTLQSAYGRAPAFDDVFPRLTELVENPTDVLAAYNETAIRTLAGELGLGATEIVLASALEIDAEATERLVRIVQEVGGGAYLTGGGAEGYQEDESFREAGIEVSYQDFRHPQYPQGQDEFEPGLSIIDALMNCGFDRTAALLKEGS